MGSFPVLVPPSPGLLCATGDLVADFRNEFARTFIRTVDQVTGDQVKGILEDPLHRSEEHTSELQSRRDLVCRLLLEKKKLSIIAGRQCYRPGACGNRRLECRRRCNPRINWPLIPVIRKQPNSLSVLSETNKAMVLGP